MLQIEAITILVETGSPRVCWRLMDVPESHWKEAFFTISTDPCEGDVMRSQHLGAQIPLQQAWLSPSAVHSCGFQQLQNHIESQGSQQLPISLPTAEQFCLNWAHRKIKQSEPSSVWTEHTGKSGRHVPTFILHIQCNFSYRHVQLNLRI